LKQLAPFIVLLFLYGCSKDSKKQPAPKTDFELANHLYNAGKLDSAVFVYSRYVANANDIFKKGQAYRYMGEILADNGDLHGAEENFAAGIHTFDPSNNNYLPEIGYLYNDLGNVNLNLNHYDSALRYYDDALQVSGGSSFLPQIMNGKAMVLQKMKRYKEAIAIYDSIFLLNPSDPQIVARLIDNRARTKWLQENSYPALPEYWRALKIRTDSQYPDLNASYAHLSDYYERSNPDSALWYANHMLAKARANKSPDDVLEAMDKLIRLNDAAELKTLYGQFKTLDDSLQFARDTTRNRFAMIRYDFQKSKADNLVLKDQNRTQRLWMYGLIFGAALSITGISLWYAKRRKRLRLASEKMIQNSKLKTSQKVHDVVANGLYRIMNELEHDKITEKELLITRIETLYEKSRDISYEEIAAGNNLSQDNPVHDLLTSFNNEQTKVFVIGNEQTFWSKLTAAQKNELQLILNEIMVNMKKHSQARNVVIEFKQEYNKGFITYKDDGTGFPPGMAFGNGLNNTVSRINSLNGEINFGKSEKEGASIAISFPL
jgi:tetratricopeptide (TPR) repeat protein